MGRLRLGDLLGGKRAIGFCFARGVYFSLLSDSLGLLGFHLRPFLGLFALSFPLLLAFSFFRKQRLFRGSFPRVFGKTCLFRSFGFSSRFGGALSL